MKIWCTKYALTTGVRELEVTQIESGIWRKGDLYIEYFYPSAEHLHWFRSEGEAMERCRGLRAAKLKALEKQIKKLREMEFEVKPSSVVAFLSEKTAADSGVEPKKFDEPER